MVGKKFNKAVIIGTGLIGGSMGLLLKQKKLSRSVVGVARHTKTLEIAIEKGAIDYGTVDVKEAVNGADLIILATPVRDIQKIITQLRGSISPGCIITDVGSTKSEIVNHAEKFLPAEVLFVGAHPMAGSEKTGVQYAQDNLFTNSICFIAQTKKTNKRAAGKIRALWKVMGAKTVTIDPCEHDKIVSQISHLPHLIAAALVDSVDKSALKYGATGFKSVTRIASGGPDIWRDISFSNRKEIISAIIVFEKTLQQIKKTLQNNNETEFTKQLVLAKKKRDLIITKTKEKAAR